jgi:hypothetical protein
MMNNISHDLPLENGGIMRLTSRPDTQSWSIFYFDSHGRRHCSHGPAINHNNNVKMWFVDGLRHREDGPALITSIGEIWYTNGLLHRLSGPAYTQRETNQVQYYIYGRQLSKEAFRKIMFRVRLACNLFKKGLRNRWFSKLSETQIFDEIYLASIVSSYII